jgi:Protein of unknown function (DUF1326)
MKVPLSILGSMMASTVAVLLLSVPPASAGLADDESALGISGRYLEVRSCDVYTGPCFANAEMGLDGKEAILVWSITKGTWHGTDLSGLSVIAVVRANETLGDLKYAQPQGDAVLIVDEKASPAQQAALAGFAKAAAKKLIGDVVQTQSAQINASLGDCTKKGTCATVTAGGLVTISTRCLSDGDHACGNEDLFYPPLTKADGAKAAFAEMFCFQGDGLNMKWATTGLRSAYVGAFTL